MILTDSIARRARTAVGALACALLLSGVTTSGAEAAPPGGPIVRTKDGPVQGATTTTTDRFLGIPYASPPVGPLRWRPPQPPARGQGVRHATTFAPECAQPGGGPFGGAGSTAEDCLYLNVFTPRHAVGRLPVMVWLHGGGLVSGGGDQFDPTKLVRNGAVVVTINYRLGALGFLAHPALTDGPHGASGNFGLMDQQAALRWVQRNISRFGGDADNVTLFGQSAGAHSVLAQLASPGARRLFDKAIVQSGTYNPTQPSLADAKTAGETFAAKAGCADQTAACLRKLSVSAILADQNQGLYEPNIDGKVLPRSLKSAFATGRFNQVPIINGTNHDEGRLSVALSTLQGNPVTEANYAGQIQANLGVTQVQAGAIAAEYPPSAYPSPAIALGAVITDGNFACNALTLDRSASRFVPTFAYEFNDPNPPVSLPPVGFPLGDYHMAELPYVFSTADKPQPSGLDAGQLRLATTMQRYWTNFAARDFPTSAHTPAWSMFTAHDQRIMSLTEPRPALETNFATDHHCAFWTANPTTP